LTPITLLSVYDLALAATLVLLLAAVNLSVSKRLAIDLTISMFRMIIQLSLVALVLKFLFTQSHFGWILGIGSLMALAAGREVTARQKYRYQGLWGFSLGTASMALSSFTLCLFSLFLIQAEPWYHPQYAIPLLGMLLGNTLNGVSICLDRLTESAIKESDAIEARLALGHTWYEATATQRHQALHSALIPTINSMAAAGLVSLPGMMTGQILAGIAPQVAVNYQILIFLLIAVSSGVGSYLITLFGTRRLFDERQRLCLERLTQKSRH